MTDNVTDLQHRIDALEERIARLSAAALRINSSLDLDGVLQEVVDSARILTNARHGIIATVDANGAIDEFVTSGFTRDEQDQMAAWPRGPELLEHFRNLGTSLRIADLASYVSAQGFSPQLVRSKTFQGTPLHHRDVLVGNFLLAGKDGDEEFSSSDEDVLKMFASQAATAIANAWKHRNEQRARSDLDTLIETSPVGVVMFDGRSAKPISFNKEARRIVEKLRTSGHSPEELLDVITCHRADGREVSLAEFPMSRHLSDPETIHAEEMTLSLPDGRSVTVLVNATPIRSADGSVESMVVILQDLAPLEELAKLRAELLGKVSDELRVPLIAIKGSSVSVLSADPQPDSNEMMQYFRVIDEQADHMRELIRGLLEYGQIATGTLNLDPIAIDVSTLIEQGCTKFRDEFKHRVVSLDVGADLPDVFVDPPRIQQTIENLLLFTSTFSDPSDPIEITATQEDQHVSVSLSARHWKVPPQNLSHFFRRYSPPSGEDDGVISNVVGTDLAIARGLIEANGGRIRVENVASTDDTRLTFTLPIAYDDRVTKAPSLGQRNLATSAKERATKTRVLVIDAHPHMQRYIQESFSSTDFETIFDDFGEQLTEKLNSFDPELILLDTQQYGFNPHNTITELVQNFDVPLILIAPDGMDEIVVTALDAGAADYVIKPFSPSELVARVKGALRRQALPIPFVLGELQIDYDQRNVLVGEQNVDLTATEYELLRVLSMNAGRVMSYSALLRQVWGKRIQTSDDPKAVRAVVKRLRNKLGDDASAPSYVCNERGVGYFIPSANSV